MKILPISAVLITCLAAAPAAVIAVEKASEQRLDEVARRGAGVMPFDLERTLHVFTKTPQGGVQRVFAKDPEDQRQIELIRQHLRQIADAFRQGDYSGPASIHGDTMPGLSTLRGAAPGQIQIDYQELPDGAQIKYTTASPELIGAIHRWFDAQLSDHARHAVSGHAHHREMHGQD